MLGIPWHVTYNPVIHYDNHSIPVEEHRLPNISNYRNVYVTTTIGVKKFRALL